MALVYAFMTIICACSVVINIMLRKEIKKLKDKTDSEIRSLHTRLNNVNYSISRIISRINTVENCIDYLNRRLR